MNITEIAEEPLYYFAYGMLTNPDFIAGTEIGKAELRGFKLELTQFANIVRDSTSTVFGALWALEPGFLDELDKVEGYPNLYRRKMFRVTVDGKVYNALAYYLTPEWRKKLRDGVPAKKYLSHIIQGYNHFGIPLSQLNTQELTEDINEKEMISEVPMNPGAYAQSLKQGASQGMIMGFEAEVLIPAATIRAVNQLIKEPPLSNEAKLAKIFKAWDSTLKWDNEFVRENIGTDWQEFTYCLQHMKGFTEAKKKKLFAVYADWLATKIKPIFAAATPQQRTKTWNAFVSDKQYYNNKEQLSKTNLNDVRKFVTWMQQYYWHSPVKIKYDEATSPLTFIREKYKGLQNFLTENGLALKLNDLEYLDPDQYDSDDWHDNDDYWEGAGSEDAPKVMKYAMTKVFGEPKVFKNYHEKKKDAVSWYVEPDGSLEPNKNADGSAEIVSPPEPVMTNLENLKKFYQLANEYKLYSNSSTGLHININIPETKLDVLKLAVFLNDDYVLKAFGRENSEYCESVLRSVKSNLDEIKPTKSIKAALTSLVKLARDYSRDHMASVSYNGTYVSFRHTGGNYLAEFDKVYNTVLRFVRAFVIASDPNAYKKEYLSKITKLFGSVIPKPKASAVTTITGIPVWLTVSKSSWQHKVRANDGKVCIHYTGPTNWDRDFATPVPLTPDQQIKYFREKLSKMPEMLQYNRLSDMLEWENKHFKESMSKDKLRIYMYVLVPPEGINPSKYLERTSDSDIKYERTIISTLTTIDRQDPMFATVAKIFVAKKKKLKPKKI